LGVSHDASADLGDSMLKQMWQRLGAHTVSAKTGVQRNINVRNEWGGFSRRLNLPVFTGWQDHIHSIAGQMRVLVSDTNWPNTAGVNNQEFWVNHALAHGGEAAFFVIKAFDPAAHPRQVEWLDDSRVLCGPIERLGTQSFISATRQVNL
jgi:hypothetical protein